MEKFTFADFEHHLTIGLLSLQIIKQYKQYRQQEYISDFVKYRRYMINIFKQKCEPMKGVCVTRAYFLNEMIELVFTFIIYFIKKKNFCVPGIAIHLNLQLNVLRCVITTKLFI